MATKTANAGCIDLTLQRSDFRSDHEGMDYFDYVLQKLGVPEDKWEGIDEIELPCITEFEVI